MGAEGTGARGGREGAVGDGADLREGPDLGTSLGETGVGEGGGRRGVGGLRTPSSVGAGVPFPPCLCPRAPLDAR